MNLRCWRAPLSCTDSAQDLKIRSLTPVSAEVRRVVAMTRLRKLSILDTATSSAGEMSRSVISRLVIQEHSAFEECTMTLSIDGRSSGRLACRMDLWPILDCAKSFQTRRLSSCLFWC
jgi:hypothetical protein